MNRSALLLTLYIVVAIALTYGLYVEGTYTLYCWWSSSFPDNMYAEQNESVGNFSFAITAAICIALLLVLYKAIAQARGLFSKKNYNS
ncbi:MAG: hypothetical protein HZA22_09155 [Nitrospirae bacterium]|nr:hypothetical protein [Nitrospirota bacterium]